MISRIAGSGSSSLTSRSRISPRQRRIRAPLGELRCLALEKIQRRLAPRAVIGRGFRISP